MIESLRELEAWGLAANQVGRTEAMCVVALPYRGLISIFNPRITKRSKTESIEEEKCLSLPGCDIEVRRPLEITVEYDNKDGVRLVEHLSGLEARILCHEVDHLEGRLLMDHLSSLKRHKLEKYIERCLRMERENLKVLALRTRPSLYQDPAITGQISILMKRR